MNITKKIIHGIEVQYIPETKYKHMIIMVAFYSKNQPLLYNERHLLPSLLEENNRIYKTHHRFNIALDQLYGALFSYSAYQLGEMFSNQFLVKFVNQKYINEMNLIDSVVKILRDIIYHPKKYRGLLTNASVNDKIKETYESLDSIKQDKATNAYYQFLKLINNEQLPSIFPFEANLESMSQESFTEAYHSMIHDDAMKIFCIGDFPENQVDQAITNYFSNFTHHCQIDDIPLAIDHRKIETFKEVVEYDIESSISRVYIGYHLHVDPRSIDTRTINILNRIIGGDSQSKLFMKIREELHLVYLIYSGYIYDSDIFMIHFESEADDENIAIDRIKEIINDVSNGMIDDDAIDKAKQAAIKSLKSSTDSLYGVLKLNAIEDMIHGRPYDTDEKINEILAVTKEMLVDLAKQLELKIIYRLKKDEAMFNDHKETFN